MFDIQEYIEATTLEQVFDAVENNTNPHLIAGGTDILVNLRGRNQDLVGASLIGITRIPELQGIELLEDGTLAIGAVSTFTQVSEHPLVREHAPVLAQATSTVGGPQTRNAGTIGGNVCNGATSGDSGATLYAYNALIEVTRKTGKKEVPIAEFYKGPGRVALEAGEIVTRILIPQKEYQGYLGYYTKFAQRKALDIANLSCVVLFKEKDGIFEDLRIAYGVAGPTPLRGVSGEAYGKGKKITDEVLRKMGQECLKDIQTRDSWRASKEYRDHLVSTLPKVNVEKARKEA